MAQSLLSNSETTPLINSPSDINKDGQYQATLPYSYRTSFLEDEDDVVTVTLKRMVSLIICSMCSWMITFILVMITLIINSAVMEIVVFAFTFAFVGSTIGVAAAWLTWIRLCGDLKLVTRERRKYLRAQGIHIDPSVDSIVEYDSLPLMRRGLVLAAAIGLLYVLALASELSFAWWFAFRDIRLLSVFAPIIIASILVLLYLFSINTLSLKSCAIVSIGFLELFIFAAKCHGQCPLSWAILSLPILLVQLHLALQLCFNLRQGLKGYQYLCALGYLLSLILMVLAEVRVSLDDINYSNSFFVTDWGFSCSMSPKIIWLMSGILFSCSALVVVKEESSTFINSKGFHDPLPLVRTSAGWDVARGQCSDTSLLLGTINLHRPQSIIA